MPYEHLYKRRSCHPDPKFDARIVRIKRTIGEVMLVSRGLAGSTRNGNGVVGRPENPQKSSMLQSKVIDGGYSSAAERLTVAQDVVGSIPTSRPNKIYST
jgi:hypothetical protein